MPLTTEQAVSTFDQLLAALQHPNPNVRAGAAIVLGKMKSARAVEPLTDLLENPVYLVYTSAAKALGMIGGLAVGSLLAVIQEPPSLDSASRAYEALRAVRDPQATGLLIAATSYDEPLIRWGAIEALGNMHAEQALPALIDAAHHPDERTRQHAVAALGKIAHPDGIQAITALLNETDWQMRVTAVEALEQIGSERVVLPLLAAMRDPTMQVREAAAHALQGLRDPQAAEILLAAFNGADAWTRRYLARSLGEIGELRAVPVLELLALDDDDVQVRLSAAQSLAKMNHPRGEAVILRTLNAPNAQTRTLAAIALGNTGSPQAVTSLLEFASAPKQNGTEYLKAIVSALLCVGEPAVPALIEALGSPEHDKTETAFKALCEIGRAAVPALLEAMPTAKTPRVCRQLIRLLGMAGDDRAVEPLAEVLRGGAVSGFSLRVLFDPTVEERKIAADALANIDTLACAAPLLSAARYDLDQEVRERAARGLAAIGDAESILQLAQPQVFGEVSRSLVSVLVLLVTGFVTGAIAVFVGNGRAGFLGGLIAGALVGLVDGLTGQKWPARGALAGAGLSAVWGVFALLFNGSPPLPELILLPPVRVGGLFFGGVGALIGVLIVNPLSREYSLRFVPRGCILVFMPGLLAMAGMLVGGVAGAVLVLRAGDPAFFRWLGGGTLGVLFLITWLQRGKKMELQEGLLAGLGLLGMVIVGIALALGVPASLSVWIALVLPATGALAGWQSLPLIRRLVGLFVGMITGFAGAGIAVLVLS